MKRAVAIAFAIAETEDDAALVKIRVVLPPVDIAMEWWSLMQAHVQGYLDPYFPEEGDIDDNTMRCLSRLFNLYGIEPVPGQLCAQTVDFAASIAYAPVIHQLVFDHRSVDQDPFRFSTRLRQAEPGPSELEYRRESLLRASVTGATT